MQQTQLFDGFDEIKDRFKIISLLGEGSFGKVVYAVCKATGQNVAIKLIKNFNNDSN